MKIKNISNSIAIINDIRKGGSGLTLPPNTEILIFDEDAEKSATLKLYINDGIIIKTGDEEPTTGVADPDVVAEIATHAGLTTGIHGLDNKLDSAKLAVYDSNPGAGGGASEALTITGLLITDTILAVSQKTAGANPIAVIGFNTLIVDGLTVVYTADPGAGSVVSVLVRKA